MAAAKKEGVKSDAEYNVRPLLPMLKSAHILFFALPAAAGLWILPFFALCFRSLLLLGHWPSSQQDHQTIADLYPIHDSFTMGWLLLTFLFFIPWLVMARALAKRRLVGHGRLLLAAAGWSLFLSVTVFLGAWYVD